MAAQQRGLGGAGGVSLESTEILSPTSPSKPAPPMAAMVMLPPPAVAAPSRSRASSREKDAAQGMKYEGVIDWLHYAPGPRLEQSRFTSVSVGDMYWRIVSPIRTQELVRARTWASARREEGAGVAGRGAASRRACAHARTCACAHPHTHARSLSPVAQTLHRNAANLLKEHGPFSHIRKASANPNPNPNPSPSPSPRPNPNPNPYPYPYP